MAKNIQSVTTTFFDVGIIDITRAKDLPKLQLPELTPFLPSDSKIEAKLTQLWKVSSLQNLLMDALIPTITNREEITPPTYLKRLKEAKETFRRMAEEERKKRKRKKKDDQSSDDQQTFENVVKDFEESESHQELLWLLRQVVHLA